ncbi:MAG: 16S rRNA (cytidine(1402)-2'-O)-methyltransferase [Saprospiraceae bacterium]|jgi:16S rRNA (cytidine1402-2'-O)-methyltransferase
MLYLVPTPVGNLEDITLRALRILKTADLILAEDTRTSRKLLDHFGITTPVKAFHAHNEHQSSAYFVQLIQEGKTIALISDAGTPGISDPGFLLVRACAQAGTTVQCLPGPTALIPAIVASGLPCDRFHFEGFLPHKKGRQSRIKYLAGLEHTFVIYESPYRLLKCLDELSTACGTDRNAAVCREISKVHEEIQRGTLAEITGHYQAFPEKIKGEIVIVVDRKS